MRTLKSVANEGRFVLSRKIGSSGGVLSFCLSKNHFPENTPQRMTGLMFVRAALGGYGCFAGDEARWRRFFS
jgi:hypothetical protein